MNILLATDSRGSNPLPNGGWTHQLMDKHPEHTFVTHRTLIETNFFTIYQMDPLLLDYADHHFDVLLLQTGFREGIEYYPKRIWQAFMGANFNENALKKPRQAGDKTLYIYVDREREKKMFDLMKQKSKRVIFIGTHTHLFEQEPEVPYGQNAKEMVTAFSQLATDYIEIPQTDEWFLENIGPDGIHCNERGLAYVLEKIERCFFVICIHCTAKK